MTRPWTMARLAPIVVGAVPVLVYNTLPAITGVLARQLGFEAQVLGAFGSGDLGGMAVGALAAMWLMGKTSPRATAMIGLLLLLATDGGSAISGSATVLVILRALGGVGEGLTMSACYYMYSLEDQQRNAAASILSQSALAMLVITVIPILAHALGWRWVFLGLGLLVIPCLVLARDFSGGYTQTDTENLSERAGSPPVILWLGLISSAFFNVAIAVYWTYVERIGAATGIEEGIISRGLSIAAALGFLGSILVIVLGERIHGSIIVATVTSSIVGIIICSSPVPWIYVTGISVYYATIPIYFSAQFAAVMRQSSSPGFAGQFALSTYVGSVGPALGGFVASAHGILAVRWLVVAFTVGSALLLWIGSFSSYAARREHR